MFVLRFGEKAPGLHCGVGINREICGEGAAKIRAFDDVALVARNMRELPLESRHRNFLDCGGKLANRHRVGERKRLAQLLLFRPAAILRSLIEARNESRIDTFPNDFILDGLTKPLYQAHDEDNQRDSDHHAEDGEEAAKLMCPNRIERKLKIFSKVALHRVGLSFPLGALRWAPAATRASRN